MPGSITEAIDLFVANRGGENATNGYRGSRKSQ